MKPNLFQGKLVRLVAEEPVTLGQAFSRWARNSEYFRLLDNDPATLRSAKQISAWFEKSSDSEPYKEITFPIHTLQEDRLIGFIGLGGFQWTHGDAWVGIGLGERDYWGKGYGTDAMLLLLRYAFTELNLFRVSLGVFEYNPRALRSYEKAGFTVEGRERQKVLRDNRRWDNIYMSILYPEWQVSQAALG